MRVAGIIVGVLVASAGAVWLLQGFDVASAPQSFMTNDRSWSAIGALAIAGGLGFAYWSWRRG